LLRGRDADARLRELDAAGRALRPVLGALAGALVERRLHEELGHRCLGDYGRERLGCSARVLREWARVWRRLEELPLLRRAVLEGEIGWTVARKVAALATPESEAACLATVRGRTVRAVEAIVAAFREAEGQACAGADEDDAPDAEEPVVVRLACTARGAAMWHAAVELARRVAGEELPVWACAEAIAAEAASAWGAGEELAAAPARSGEGAQPKARPDEEGLRHRAWPGLSWRGAARQPPPEIAALGQGLERASALEVHRRLRAATAFLQRIDFETGRALRQVLDRRLHRELGFESFGRYAAERLDLAPRTARRLVALARAEHRAPAVATAFRRGEIHAFQAATLRRVADEETGGAWVAWARAVTLRRLEAETAAAPQATLVFHAPRDVALLFCAMLRRAGSLEALLAHALDTWRELGARFRDYADFERDGWRCTVPGCTARKGLESHHVRFLSAGGPDEPGNRTTLCHFHHHRGVHARRVRIRGRAPDSLLFELGGERFRSGDVRV
jgi:hypothetical protein